MSSAPRQLARLLLAASATCACASIAHASDEFAGTLSQVKAAYVLNFMKFTEWPATAFGSDNSPLVIVCIGDPALASDLTRLFENQRVHNRTLAVRSVAVVANRDRGDVYTKVELGRISSELKGSHAVVISDSLWRGASALVESAFPPNVLSVGYHKRFAESGVMLALSLRNNRVLFYANPLAIEASELRISSKVLRLANLVRPE